MNLLHHWLCRSGQWRRTLQERVPWVLDGVDLGPNVLETGPGPGLTTELLLARVPQLTVIESDAHLARSLRRRMRTANVAVVAGDATTMPFANAVFSGCACFTMLHHVPSRTLQDQLLREVWRVLRPGGVFAGSDSLQNILMRLIHIADTFVPVDADTFAARLQSAGFEVLSVGKSSRAFKFHARRPAE